ncbi:MAG: hypothetical protein RL571_2038 [Pseudomonadota bacterium]|jgi:hypothetical protein
MSNAKDVLTRLNSIHTTDSNKNRPVVQHKICDPLVPAAANSIIGQCEYYYRPLHQEFVQKSGVSTMRAIITWAVPWNPWEELKVVKKLLVKRDKLIVAQSADGDWSRHASFMMRHISCNHRPPDYYVSYGYYYCSIYGEKLLPKLSPEGQLWLKSGRLFLQRNMEKGINDNMQGGKVSIPCKRYPNQTVSMDVAQFQLELNSDKFKEFAFSTHVPAYLDAGLADLSPIDLGLIGGQPNIEEWGDPATWKQAILSGTEVGKDKAQEGFNLVKNLFDKALNRLMEPFK